MKSITKPLALICVAATLVCSGCLNEPALRSSEVAAEVLVVHTDGSLEFRNKPIPREDVVIYADGLGGERAAVKMHMEPLHPDFFRDSIVVERRRTGN